MGDRNMKPGDWICGSCQTHNFASRSLCFSCQAPGRPGATSGGFGVGPATGMKPGDWLCPRPTCKFQNFSSRQECMRCGSQKPGTTAGGAGVMAGHGRPTQGVPSKVLPGDWFCNQCNINNFASRTRCMQCGGPNTGGGRTIDRPGDWSCPNDSCRYHNFSSRTECYRCGTAKGPGQGPSNSSSPGFGGSSGRPIAQMKPGDWLCPNSGCGFHNFARREACGQCSTPAPVSNQSGEGEHRQSTDNANTPAPPGTSPVPFPAYGQSLFAQGHEFAALGGYGSYPAGTPPAANPDQQNNS